MEKHDEYALADRFNLKEWKRIFAYVRPYKKDIAVLSVAAVGTGIFDAIFPMMTAYAITNFIEAKTLEGIGPFITVFLVLALIQLAFNVIYTQRCINIEMGVGRDMRFDLFSHVQELSLDYFNATPVGFILARIMSDTQSLGAIFSWQLAAFAWNVAYIISAAVNMFILNPALSMAVLLTIPVVTALAGTFQRKLLAANRIVRRQNSLITSAYNENINGAVTIKELNSKEKINREFAGINHEMRRKSLAAKWLQTVFFPCIMVISSAALAFVLGMGPVMVSGGALTVASLSVFISYTFTLLDPIEHITRSFTQIMALQANVERVNSLMDARPTVTDRKDIIEKYGDIYNPVKENWEEITGDIEFRNVSFRYPDSETYVLENFNLKVKAGTCVAIVGATGAGKSTLVNLVCRFFEPTSGQILIDGVDYRERSYLWLQSNLSYVLQTPHLFSGTILENIKYANPEATMEQVIAAAKQAQAHSFIEKLPDGYDTEVGQGGDRLSTGQKQLVSIARAILADGKILVMDEATSSVDTQTEQLINGMTDRLLKDRTSFIIAHRLSTVKNADIIIVVDEGKIVEMGTHTRLLKAEGQYYRMYTGQWEEKRQNEFFRSLKEKKTENR
ncbi:MAG: ABC transporter ATP-binding protein [Oscillospiraceae bacterium]|nr:ABC transporter ATP-binding protein [Oscillospiraceae bacterium]